MSAISWKNPTDGRDAFDMFVFLRSDIYLKGHFYNNEYKFPLTESQKNAMFNIVEDIVDRHYVGPTTVQPKPNYIGDIYIYQHKDMSAANLEICFITGFETIVKMDGFFDTYVDKRGFNDDRALVTVHKCLKDGYQKVQSALDKNPGLFKFVAHKKL